MPNQLEGEPLGRTGDVQVDCNSAHV
jgi:hypothetical protein